MLQFFYHNFGENAKKPNVKGHSQVKVKSLIHLLSHNFVSTVVSDLSLCLLEMMIKKTEIFSRQACYFLRQRDLIA